MEAPISNLGGAVFKLPVKLDGLLRHGDMLPKGAVDEIPLIKRDLKEIIAILQDHISRLDNPLVIVNCWMKEVRELSYDIEDCIDQYEHTTDSKSKYVCKIPCHKFALRKTNRLSDKLKQRLWMANKIREFSVRVQEALQRHKLYIGHTPPPPTPVYDVPFRSPHHIVHGEASDLVGIDAPMNKLEELMIKDGEQKLKVVSIVGVGGIGKTTLANEIYCKLGGQFDCRAFVRASQKPDMRRLLTSMLSQVRPHQPPDTWKVHNLIAAIRTHLKDKRYLIVADDVWATSTWDTLNCALPEDNSCSRILITTEIEDVAHKCCGYESKYVFRMKPLGDDDSRKLFFNSVFGPQYECPPELREVSNNIIRKCGGVPLATVTIARLLASQMVKLEQWDYVNKSLGYGLRTNTTLEGMKQVLNLSYDNLPSHLKACMLYLSIYEEDYIIWKDDLVKQWIAEGFLCSTEEQDKEEIFGSYFDELVSRRMIQPVRINENDEVLSCVVHHMVLKLITYKSIEENFAIAIDHSQTTTRFADKVRRLSLHFGNTEDAMPPTNMRLSQVRTLAFFGVIKCLPSIVEFWLLQVLILHIWGDKDSISFDLTRISELFRLRYLQVTCNVTLELGTQMRGLQCLETLKIDARASVVPSDIIHLPSLLHLNLPAKTNLPNGIDHMTQLRTLGYFDLSGNSIENVKSLGELTNLQDLQLTCYTIQPDNLKSNMQCLGSILGKLNNLKSLTLVPAGGSFYVNILDVAGATRRSNSSDGLSSVSSPPALIQRLELSLRVCIFSTIPTWIGHLDKLCILKIGVRELARSDVDVLRGLPALAVLSLYVHTKPAERVVFDKAGFLVLKYFKFRCSVAWLKFEAGAMPNLRKLKLGFNAHRADQYSTTMPVGIEHLSCLTEISAKIGSTSAEEPDRRSIELALSETIKMHPGHPNVNIQCVDRMFGAGSMDSITTLDPIQGATPRTRRISLRVIGTAVKWLIRMRRGRFNVESANKGEFRAPPTMASAGTSTQGNYKSTLLTKILSPKFAIPSLFPQGNRADVLQLQSDLQHLRESLPTMYDLIDRAEWRSHEKCVADLLQELKDAVYDADDLLDEFRWYEQKMEVEGNVSQSPFIDFFNTVIQGNFNKVKDIQERLKNLSNQLEKMGLREVTQRFHKSVRPETSCFPTETKIFGRDDELKKVMGSLGVPTESSRAHLKRKRARSSVNASASNQVGCRLDNNEARMSGVPVLPIVGIGGVGKTTLAQHICNHPQVKSRFDLIIWICVSNDFDVKRLTKEAIQSSTSGKEAEMDHLDSLQQALAKNVKNKRFLFILDDMWDDFLKEDMLCWKRFCAPLTSGLLGSMMLVTTRSPEVADGVRTMEPIPLEGLKDDVFWDFFKLCVFGSDCSNNDSELESIGRSILPKLKGSPLAAKTLGRLLRMNLHPTHWNNILKSELWELKQKETDILPALRLSYIYLPFHLKRCFSFCAVYPKDHKFQKHKLAEIWVAEGFVEPQGDIPIQDIGCQYFEELVNRSFFQKVSGKYVIHDLLHDMAQLVSGHDCFVLKDTSDFGKVPQNVRHMSILSSTKVDRSNLLSLCKHTKLRTLLCNKSLGYKTLASVLDSWCSELRYMRVISCAYTSSVPDSIGNLKHLRYLEISRACPFNSLPSAFWCLYNLQFIHASKCKLESLPNDLSKLLNLQVFEFILPSKLRIDGANKQGSGITILKNLNQFCGDLFIFNLHQTSKDHAAEAQLKNKKDLYSLSLEWSFQRSPERNEKEVLQVLQPPTSLKSLCLLHYPGESLPSWFQAQNLPNLRSLEFRECHGVEGISFSSVLQHRNLNEMPGVLDNNNGSICTFSSMTDLTIHDCNNLSLEQVEHMPAIKTVRIYRCGRLVSLPTARFGDCLEILQVIDCPNFSQPGESFASFPLLKTLEIGDCPSLNWQRGFVLPPSLEMLFLYRCGDISAWFPSCLENLTSLVSLSLYDCAGIESIPGHLWSSNLASLQELWIVDCPDLVDIGGANAIANIEKAFIDGCPMQIVRKRSWLLGWI